MKKTVYLHEFREDFRIIRPDSFTYEGLETLFNILVEIEEDTGEEIEFDVIEICYDYAEGDFEEIASDYSIDLPGKEDYENEEDWKEDAIDSVRKYLEDNTTYAQFGDGRFIYCQSF